jgi:hypothetical protein
MLLAELRMWPKIPTQRLGVAAEAENRLETTAKPKPETNRPRLSALRMKERLRVHQSFLCRPVRHKKGEPSLERSISHGFADWQN